MSNIYLTGLPYNELVIAEEDFIYGTKVKCSIPSLVKPIKHRPSSKAKKIMNEDPEILGINKNVKCEDTVDIMIPVTYAKNPSNPEKGKKGDKFAIAFLGAGQFNYVICGRVDNE